jgi:hypothetical protein
MSKRYFVHREDHGGPGLTLFKNKSDAITDMADMAARNPGVRYVVTSVCASALCPPVEIEVTDDEE